MRAMKILSVIIVGILLVDFGIALQTKRWYARLDAAIRPDMSRQQANMVLDHFGIEQGMRRTQDYFPGCGWIWNPIFPGTFTWPR
jgi:hypothetical protein